MNIISLAAATAFGTYVGWGVNRMLTIKPIEKLDTPQPLDEHKEARQMDDEDIDSQAALSYIHLGDLSVPCPICNTQVDEVAVGVSIIEDKETETNEYGLNELSMFGMFYYSCGHLVYSPCFANKVSTILNAEEVGQLSPGLFENLVHCEEHSHGVV